MQYENQSTVVYFHIEHLQKLPSNHQLQDENFTENLSVIQGEHVLQ